MSEKGMRRMNDRRGFRRMQKQKKAVSPVVATLILILIAVAAAAALYLWLVSWQTGVTNGVGSPGAQYTVSIGGSTSVYPFDSYAVTQFEQNNSDVVVSNNQGGSGAGMLSVCANNVDIGTASSLETVTQLEEPIASGGYGCQSFPTPTITTVAYDAVDVIVATANTHGLANVGADTLLTIYIANGGGIGAFTGSAPHGYTFPQANGVSYGATVTTGIVWDQIPACVTGTAACGGAGNPAEAPTTAAPAGANTGTVMAACPSGVDICTPVADTSPCGFTVCAGPFGASTPTVISGTATDAVQQWGRADTSGTEQSFTARILGLGDSAGTAAGLGFSGCSPDGQLASCGINPPTAQLGNGNPAVISGVAAHPDAIGFASDGLARASGSGVTFLGFESVGQTSAVTPTTGSSGTIANGILSAGAVTAQYQGWRPFEYVTLGTPTGETERFIQFVLDPANNQAFATESAEVSIYSI
jgi:flagellin-like protein